MRNLIRAAVAAAAITMAPAAFAAGEGAGGDAAAGEKVAKVCQACHKFGPGAKNAFGPVLNGVVGRPIGSYPGYRYDKGVMALNAKGLVWTEDLIFEWLMNPSEFVQNHTGDPNGKSKMPLHLADETKRRDVVAFLKTLKVEASGMSMGANSSEGGGRVTHGDAPHHPALDAAMKGGEDPLAGMPRVKLDLVAPPFAPKHSQVADGRPKIVEIELTVMEKEWEVDDKGTKIRALTYNGSIPAPLMIVHQDDYVELTLKNPSTNLMEHNIDLHAATGALGGAGLTTLSPGEETVLRFKATKAGVFLYHCAPEGSMTPYHVTHGMTGAILVLPRDGIKDDEGNRLAYDHIFYVGENDFYVPKDENGEFKTYAQSGDDFQDWIDVMHTLLPSHIVFNGKVGALTGNNALKANVGDSALFLHVQGNRDTRPHLIGGHGDYVWETGTFESPPLKDLQTWFIRGGSAGAMWYEFKQPGVYVYLNHNLIEAVEFGAAAHVVVEGDWDDDLMKQVYKGPLR